MKKKILIFTLLLFSFSTISYANGPNIPRELLRYNPTLISYIPNQTKNMAYLEEKKSKADDSSILRIIHQPKRYDEWSEYDLTYLENKHDDSKLLEEMEAMIKHAENIKKEEVVKIGDINVYPFTVSEKLKALENSIHARQVILQNFGLKRERIYPEYSQESFSKKEVLAYQEHQETMIEAIREVEKEISKIKVINEIISDIGELDMYIAKSEDDNSANAFQRAILFKVMHNNKAHFKNIIYHELAHIIDRHIFDSVGKELEDNIENFYRTVLNMPNVRLEKEPNKTYNSIRESFAVDFSILMNHKHGIRDLSVYKSELKGIDQSEKEVKYDLLINFLENLSN